MQPQQCVATFSAAPFHDFLMLPTSQAVIFGPTAFLGSACRRQQIRLRRSRAIWIRALWIPRTCFYGIPSCRRPRAERAAPLGRSPSLPSGSRCRGRIPRGRHDDLVPGTPDLWRPGMSVILSADHGRTWGPQSGSRTWDLPLVSAHAGIQTLFTGWIPSHAGRSAEKSFSMPIASTASISSCSISSSRTTGSSADARPRRAGWAQRHGRAAPGRSWTRARSG